MSTDTNLAQYWQLCDQRDAVNTKNEPLEAELTKVNAQIAELQAKAQALADMIDDNRGRSAWTELKKQIRFLAAGLGRIPPRA